MSVENGLKLLLEHGVTVSRMLAYAILRGKRRNWLFGKWLANRLLANYQFSVLLDMMHVLTLGSGLQDFINIIGLMKAIRLTKPNDPSQRET